MTNLMRWNPLQELQRINTEMNDWFRGFGEADLRGTAWVPPVDIEETQDSIRVEAELPGMKKEDIQIDFSNGLLTIRGQRTFSQEKKERNYHRVERSYGSFERSFRLPTSVDPDRISASYENGVLRLELSKKEEAKPRRIEIKGSSEGPRQIETGSRKSA